MALQKIKGQNFRVFVGSAAVNEAVNCSIQLNGNMEDNSTKDTESDYSAESMTSKSWQVQVDSYDATAASIKALLTRFNAGAAVTVGFDQTEATPGSENRTAANVRSAFTKGKGNIGTTGCVSFMFQKKGQIIVSKEEYETDPDDFMMLALDAGAEDFEEEDDSYEILTDPDSFGEVREALADGGARFGELFADGLHHVGGLLAEGLHGIVQLVLQGLRGALRFGGHFVPAGELRGGHRAVLFITAGEQNAQQRHGRQYHRYVFHTFHLGLVENNGSLLYCCG